MEVSRENQVCAFGNGSGQPFGQSTSLRADSPSAQIPDRRGLVAGCAPQIAGAEKASGKSAHSPAVTGHRVFFVPFAGFACGVEKEETMMDDGAGPGSKLNRFDP